MGTDAGCPFNPYEAAAHEMVLMVMAALLRRLLWMLQPEAGQSFWIFQNLDLWKQEKKQALCA